MKIIIVGILKSLFSESLLKTILAALGDHLVKSSKNQLDDKIWAKVKEKLLV